MSTKFLLVLLILGSLASAGWAQQAQTPMTEKDVLKLIKKHKKDQMKAAATVSERGVSFDVTPDFQRELEKAGAELGFFQAVVGASPSGRSFKTPLGNSIEVNPAEKVAFMQVQNELDPERQLALVAEFEQKHSASPLMSYVCSRAARLYQQKGEYAKTVEYGERSLKLDPNNVFSLVIVAMMLPQPRMLQGTPAENDKSLATAESYATRALELIEQIPAEMLEKDEQLQKQKASLSSDAHSALGMVALIRDDQPKAVDEFKAAISTATGANPLNYFRLGEAYENMGKLDQAIDAFQHAADLGQGTILKTHADKKIEETKARKALIGPR
jgi:tetratricopeptide (TPR) repeat protein